MQRVSRRPNVTRNYHLEFAEAFVGSPDCESGSTASRGGNGLRNLQPVVADTPFAAVGVAELACGGGEGPAPAAHPERGLLAMDLAQDRFDGVVTFVEIGQPVLRCALVMRTAPAPFLFDREQVGILANQVMARHHAAAEEVLRD